METRVWGKEDLKREFSGCTTLKEVIARIEERRWKEGHVVCHVRVNGLALTEEDEARLATSTLHEIEKVEVTSSPPAELVGEAVASYANLMPDLKEECVETAEMFRGSDVRQAQSRFSKCLEGCHWMTDALTLLKTNLTKWLNCEISPQWLEAEASYVAAMRDMVKAYEAKDYVLLGDLLEYELSNSLDQWLDVLQTTAESVQSPPIDAKLTP